MGENRKLKLKKLFKNRLTSLSLLALAELKEELVAEDVKIRNKASNDIITLNRELNYPKVEAQSSIAPSFNFNFITEGLKALKEISNEKRAIPIQPPAEVEEESANDMQRFRGN